VFSLSNSSIATVAINNRGDWLAFGCQEQGQLLVWDWQSESYITKQQGHFNNMTAFEYSPDSRFIATGGQDGKVRLK